MASQESAPPSLARRFSPARWPVRWRLAGVSAILTFVILLTFAAVVGKLSQERLENDFRNELQATANRIAFSIEIDADTGQVEVPIEELTIGDEVVRVTPSVGEPIDNIDVPLPPPSPDIVRSGGLDVATAQVATTLVGAGVTHVQVGREHDELDATIGRLWLFLAIGVAGGSILATLAGLAVASRAMGPIAALTSTAKEIAATRDPARRMPKSEAEDEVAELAITLDEMLRELDAARNEAQGMVNAQREFVADASHELRTPLTSILANLELLQAALERGPGNGEEAEMIESALRSSRRMRRLVGDLLILARADAGRHGARRPCDLAAITEAAASELRPLAPRHTIAVTAEPTSVQGNPDELHRVALNLIDNGARHTPQGSTVTVRVYQREREAVLEVADDGPGIPEALTSQIFGRFVRGTGPADVTADTGAGLGLSIVRAVASAHGGSVTVGASPHGGALFTVRLPALAEATAEPPRKLSRVL